MNVVEKERLLAVLKTENTQKAAVRCVNKLESYLTEHELSMASFIESLHNDNTYAVLQQYIGSLSMMPSSVKQNFAFVKKYLRIVHGVKLDTDDIKYEMSFPTILKRDGEPLTVPKIKQLIAHSNDYYKALWLVLLSSGMRISEALQVTPNMIVWDNPVMIRLPAKITKTKRKRITFISKEAAKLVEQLDFFETHNLNAVESYFGKLRKRAGLVQKYEDSINYHTNIHAFRSFFRTQAGKINYDFAEQVLGHEGYLKQYIRLEDEDKIKYYKKTEPLLKIF